MLRSLIMIKMLQRREDSTQPFRIKCMMQFMDIRRWRTIWVRMKWSSWIVWLRHIWISQKTWHYGISRLPCRKYNIINHREWKPAVWESELSALSGAGAPGSLEYNFGGDASLTGRFFLQGWKIPGRCSPGEKILPAGMKNPEAMHPWREDFVCRDEKSWSDASLTGKFCL